MGMDVLLRAVGRYRDDGEGDGESWGCGNRVVN